MKKIFLVSFIFIFFVLVVLVFVGCSSIYVSSSAVSSSDLPSNTSITSINGNDEFFIWVDPDTGVNYIVFKKKSGYAGFGGISPRYNPDGSLYISEVP